MRCFICHHHNMTGNHRCAGHNCIALLSTADIVKFYTTVLTVVEGRTALRAVEHYIVRPGTPDARDTVDAVLQIQGSGFRAMVVWGENCGGRDCRNVIRCPHSSIKISIAEKTREGGAGYGPTMTVAYP
ncbi:6a06ca93-27cc-459a-9bdb-8d6583abab94-CDS [Sclerotinia trifoliorum]|uniref:6a06ca93-27cc-459a-9bdb-8d6583abab94-CDS n=1 Tax=Sclerotinia trifoliorum TaxID=28548 RepID=A0A8H2ZQI4_9HELO|nr:6a06ca93-27cc-459a-9bdb-8d6583abab94-CDS [Sclerotinia trifoliorum]